MQFLGFVNNGFRPENDIPDLSGKVILVTGGNSGLGKESVLQLAKHNPSQIFLAARSAETGQTAVEEVKAIVPGVKIVFLQLDLSSYASISKAAKLVNASVDRLDILMNNAGIMMTPPNTTMDGFEIQFGTNHIGHALLTKLLLPKLQATAKEHPGADVRIITLSSSAHKWAPEGGLDLGNVHSEQRNLSTRELYGQSKLANILYSNELARRYPDIRCISLHPGSVNTGLSRGLNASYPLVAPIVTFVKWTKIITLDVHEGTLNQLWAATAEEAESGKYYNPVGQEVTGSKYAHDLELAKELWDFTEAEFKKLSL
ncbi:putative oxidoreductase [Lachnellula hyalina]|uniref:Putative oxidoreductase n=1 Tax=Lachnellula hyalina TaxID=1316788 RepID=A0A8H8R0E6_9HELO|nr:putative oxidoreductase [Lachnellula hyalina]TVY26252.1 putative oxidoreductase [Lachnellula hyalina]